MLYLSASRIGDYKDCPILYKLPVIDRIYPMVEADPLRMGTNWHEIQYMIGKDEDIRTKQNVLIDFIDLQYSECPTHISMEDWLIERNIFLYTAWAYFNYYNDSCLEVIESELPFELSLLHPETGRAVPNVRIRGVIDKIVKYPDGRLFIREYKSTSSAVDNESSFWKNLRMAIQPSIYYDAARRLGYDISGIEYDIWRKPTIRPKFLTQKDTKEFLESEKYLNQEFDIEPNDSGFEIDGEKSELKIGKQGDSIKESSRMFGVRLYNDIMERPEYYFNNQEISRTESDMEKFRWELYYTYQTMKNMIKSGYWFGNEKNCERMGKCQYTPICYNNINVDEYIPEGFYKKENK